MKAIFLNKIPHIKSKKTPSCGIPTFNLTEKMIKVIPVKVQPSLKETVKAVASSSVSEFCREAIIEKLERLREEQSERELEGSG